MSMGILLRRLQLNSAVQKTIASPYQTQFQIIRMGYTHALRKHVGIVHFLKEEVLFRNNRSSWEYRGLNSMSFLCFTVSRCKVTKISRNGKVFWRKSIKKGFFRFLMHFIWKVSKIYIPLHHKAMGVRGSHEPQKPIG